MDRIKAGEPVLVWSGVLNEWLYWVRGESERQALIDRGIEPGRVYTPGELAVIANWTGSMEELRKALQDVHTFYWASCPRRRVSSTGVGFLDSRFPRSSRMGPSLAPPRVRGNDNISYPSSR